MTMSPRSEGLLSLTARTMIAALFLFSGLGKLAAPGSTIGYIASKGLPLPELAYAMALVVELGVASLLIIGLKTRWTAGALAVFSLVAGLAFHSDLGDQNQLVHLLKNIAIAGGLLQICVYGGGPVSVDARRARS